jgi:hypothetical protein
MLLHVTLVLGNLTLTNTAFQRAVASLTGLFTFCPCFEWLCGEASQAMPLNIQQQRNSISQLA